MNLQEEVNSATRVNGRLPTLGCWLPSPCVTQGLPEVWISVLVMQRKGSGGAQTCGRTAQTHAGEGMYLGAPPGASKAPKKLLVGSPAATKLARAS